MQADAEAQADALAEPLPEAVFLAVPLLCLQAPGVQGQGRRCGPGILGWRVADASAELDWLQEVLQADLQADLQAAV